MFRGKLSSSNGRELPDTPDSASFNRRKVSPDGGAYKIQKEPHQPFAAPTYKQDDKDKYSSARRDLLKVQETLAVFGRTKKKEGGLSPNSVFMWRWDFVCFMGLVYTATATPYDIAFRFDESNIDVFFFVNRVVDCVFLADMFVNFVLKFREDDEESGQWVTDYGRIAEKYLKSWFLVDLISMIPFDLISMAMTSSVDSQSEIGLLNVLKLFRLFKLARIVRLMRILRRFEDHLSLSFASQSILTFLSSVFLMCHWLACTWRITVTMEQGYEVSWFILEGYSTLHSWDAYVTCLYWATSTITTIGYGNAANPITTYERLVAVFCMCFGAACWAYVIGAISGIVGSFNGHELEYRETMDTLNMFMRYRRLPQDLRIRLRAFFRFRRRMVRDFAYSQLFESMSPALRGEVAWQTNKEWLAKVPWAITGSPGFITTMSMALRPAIFAPKELIEGANLNIVTRGVLARGAKIITRGGVWGIDVILRANHLKRKIPARTLTFVQTFSLDTETLSSIQDSYPVEKARLRKAAVWMALRRGVILYAIELRRIMLQFQDLLEKKSLHSLYSIFREHDPTGEGTIDLGMFKTVLGMLGITISDFVLPTLQRMCDHHKTEGIRIRNAKMESRTIMGIHGISNEFMREPSGYMTDDDMSDMATLPENQIDYIVFMKNFVEGVSKADKEYFRKERRRTKNIRREFIENADEIENDDGPTVTLVGAYSPAAVNDEKGSTSIYSVSGNGNGSTQRLASSGLEAQVRKNKETLDEILSLVRGNQNVTANLERSKSFLGLEREFDTDKRHGVVKMGIDREADSDKRATIGTKQLRMPGRERSTSKLARSKSSSSLVRRVGSVRSQGVRLPLGDDSANSATGNSLQSMEDESEADESARDDSKLPLLNIQ